MDDVFRIGTLDPDQPPSHLTIQERFERFDATNPWVFTALEDLTRDLIRHHAHKIGIGNLWEVIRWQYQRTTHDPSGFKVNNNYRSRYVRKLIEVHPQWQHLFELRRLRAL